MSPWARPSASSRPTATTTTTDPTELPAADTAERTARYRTLVPEVPVDRDSYLGIGIAFGSTIGVVAFAITGSPIFIAVGSIAGVVVGLLLRNLGAGAPE